MSKKSKAKKAVAKKSAKPKLKSIAPALGKLVAEAENARRAEVLKIKAKLTPAERRELLRLAPRPDDHRWPSEIHVGKRFRKTFKHLEEMSRSIEKLIAAGQPGLLQPVGVTPKDELIFGERRMLGWKQSSVALTHPLPVRVIDIKAIIVGEYIENDPKLRQNFTLEESVDIVRAMTVKQRELVAAEQAARPAETRAAPGRKAEAGKASGRVAERAASFVGKDRKTIAKAAAIKDAAEEDPARFGSLLEDMNRTGKADGPFRRLEIMRQTDAMRASPPKMPDGDHLYETAVFDFAWPHEPDMDQDQIDASGRSTRPYPAMSIKEGCHFMRDVVAPRLAPKCTVYFWTTNFHMPYAYQLLAALGFTRSSTIGTWGKDKIGRGRILRERTEHCIIMHRGGALIALSDDTTLWEGPGWETRESSQKPKAFYELVERKSPAERYLSVFSRGGEGERWDCYGDQTDMFAAPAAAADEQAEWKALGAIEADVSITGPMLNELIAHNLIGGEAGRTCGWSLTAAGTDRLALLEAKFNPPAPAIEPWRFQLAALSRVEGGNNDIADIDPKLYDGLIEGKRSRKLTPRGRARLAQLRQLSTLEDLERVAGGELSDDPKRMVADGLAARGCKRLTKHGERTLTRLREFARHFHATEAAADEHGMVKVRGNSVGKEFLTDEEREQVAATSEFQRDMGFDQVGGLRVTPAGEPTVPDIVKPDMIVRTNYESGPYRVLEVTGPFYMEDDRTKAWPHWSLCMVRADEKKKGKKAKVADSWINELVAVGGRLLKLFEANDDEVFIVPAEGSSPAEDPQPADRADEAAPAENEIAPTAAPDQAAIDAFENADLYRIPQDVSAAIVKRGGHIITQTIDWDSGGDKGTSVATCECGVTYRADRTLPYSGENAIAPQIEAHWREVLAADQVTADPPSLFVRAAALAAPAQLEMPELPPELRRAVGE